MTGTTLRIEIPEKMRAFLSPARYKIAHGGRGGGKSWAVARLLLALGMSKPLRVLCTREVQKSLRESVYRLLVDQIGALDLGRFYDVQNAVIKGANGTEFLFAGLQDHTVDSIKSYEGVDIAWIEEAHSVSARSWEILTPTIRKPGSEIWATFNPTQEDDPVYQRFVVNHDPQAVVVKINWRDNPWFPAVLDVERRAMQAINDDLYQHIWEGKCRSQAGLLFKRRWFKRYKLGEHPKNLRMYMSTDYAGAPDPDEPEREPDWNEFGVGGVDTTGGIWFVDWYSGQEDAADWLPAWTALARRYMPRAVFEEKGTILRTIDGTITRELQRIRLNVYRHPIASASSKADRALGFAAYASTNDVWVPECEWGDRLINQLCAFTGQDGKVDDMVDVCSLMGRGVAAMQNALQEPANDRPPLVPFTEPWHAARDRHDAESRREAEDYYR